METLRMQLDLRGVFMFFYLLLILLLFAGCSAVDLSKTIALPQNPVSDSRKFTIAVLPFETIEQPVEDEIGSKAKYGQKPPEKPYDEKWRDFESKYFPARLVHTLLKSPWIREAYVSPVITPSVDYLVKGGIVESNGEVTTVSITLARCCWTDVHTEVFSIDLASSHFTEEMRDPGALLWIDPVNKIGEVLAKVTVEQRKSMEDERVTAYLGEAAKRLDLRNRPSKVDSRVVMASGWERTKLLRFVTDTTLGKAEKSTFTYAQWQKDNTKLWEEKRRHDVQTAISVFSAAVSLGGGMASARLGGPTTGFGSAFVASVGGAIKSSKAAAKVSQEIEMVRQTFGEEMEPTTIELNGEVYTLTGRSDAQLAQIKQIARSQILKALEQ